MQNAITSNCLSGKKKKKLSGTEWQQALLFLHKRRLWIFIELQYLSGIGLSEQNLTIMYILNISSHKYMPDTHDEGHITDHCLHLSNKTGTLFRSYTALMFNCGIALIVLARWWHYISNICAWFLCLYICFWLHVHLRGVYIWCACCCTIFFKH